MSIPNVSLFARQSVSSTQALDLTFSSASSRPQLNDDLLHIVFSDVLDLLSDSTRNSGRGAAMLPFTLVCQAWRVRSCSCPLPLRALTLIYAFAFFSILLSPSSTETCTSAYLTSPTLNVDCRSSFARSGRAPTSALWSTHSSGTRTRTSLIRQPRPSLTASPFSRT